MKKASCKRGLFLRWKVHALCMQLLYPIAIEADLIAVIHAARLPDYC